MKIIVIGMDNTGKTTLSDRLSEELGCKHIKSPGPNLSKEEMLDDMIKNLSSEDDILLERFSMIEELIYGNTLRNKSKFTVHELVETLQKYKPTIIYCRASEKNIFNFGEREQMEGVIDNSVKLLSNFDQLVKFIDDFKFDVITYNYETKSFEELKEEIHEHNTCKKRVH